MSGPFCVTVHPQLPRLAWVAEVDRRSLTTTVRCGSDVEAQDGFVIEGLWEGPFGPGRFDRAVHVFGSGARVLDDAVVCSASSALVDRLLYAEDEHRVVCSNSLPLLLAATGATLDERHDYTGECRALMAGRRRYERRVHARSDRPLRFGQVYGENLRIERAAIRHEPRPDSDVPLNSFARYEQALRESLAVLCSNLQDPTRRIATSLTATVSTGYDSAAAAALAKAHGVKSCFTTSPERDPTLEDGAAVARALGLDPVLLSRSDPEPSIEQALLSSTLDGRESVFASMAATLTNQHGVTALLTGYHGDKMWSRDTAGEYLSPDIRRGDTSGLNLSEARLHAGFINLAVPFLHAPRIAQVVAVSNSEEMARWQLGNDYDRPIPRRIVEEANVPRTSFGQRKSVVMDYGLWPRSESLRQRLREHLRARHGYGRLSHIVHEASGIADYRIGRLFGGRNALSLRLRLWPGHRQLANRIFVWAVNESARDLAMALGESEAPRSYPASTAAVSSTLR